MSAQRAARLRADLLAIADAHAVTGAPLRRSDLARLTGASLRQDHRHIERLRDCGQIVTRRGQNCAYVVEVVS